MRDAAYASILEEDRATLHLSAGAWLESVGDVDVGLIARHADHSTVHFTAEGEFPWLQDCPGVSEVLQDGARYRVRGTGPLLAHVASALVAHGHAPADLSVERATLEDVFLRLSDDVPEDTP